MYQCTSIYESFQQTLEYNIGCETLASSGGRALGVIINKFKDIKDSGYETFTKLYSTGVEPILDYFSGNWCNDVNTCKAATNVFNRAHQYYIGLPVCTTLAGMYGMDAPQIHSISEHDTIV